MLDVGRLDKRIMFMKQAEDVGAFSETTQEWLPWKSMWATIHPIRSFERKNGNQRIEDEADYRITVRYQPYGDQIDADMKIKAKIRGKIRLLEIIGDPIDKDSMGEFLEMQAKEYRVTTEEDLFS